MVEISLILDTPLKGKTQGVYIGPRMIPSPTQTFTINQHRLEKEGNSNQIQIGNRTVLENYQNPILVDLS